MTALKINQNWKVILNYYRTVISLFFLGILLAPIGFTRDPIKIGLEDINYFPAYNQLADDKKGYVIDFLDELSANGTLDGTIRFLPIARLKHSFKQGAIDLMFPDNPAWNTESNQERHYSHPISEYQDGLITIDDTTFDKLSDVTHIATLRGFTVELLPSGQNNVVIERVDRISSLFQMLKSGRVEAIYMNYNVAFNVAPDGLKNRLNRLENLGTISSSFHFSSYNLELIQAINSYMEISPETLPMIKANYGRH